MDSESNQQTSKTKSKIHVIGCGPTAVKWDGQGYSIGVNDCWAFGNPTDELVVVNPRSQFTERRQWVIDTSTPKVFHTIFPEWRHAAEKMINQYSRYTPGRIPNGKTVYYGLTSPFMAVSIAFNYGAEDIILWGVDLTNHRIVNGSLLADELKNWKVFRLALSKKNCNLWLGTDSPVMGKFIPVYENRIDNANQRG